MPLYAKSLGARDSEIGLLLGLFAAAAMVLRLPVGWYLDRGRRVPALVVGAIIFAISSAGYALTGTIAALLALRLFHGTGMAIFTTAGQTLAVDIAPAGRRGETLGIYGTATNIAAMLGPAIGMALASAVGFRQLFLICAGIATSALILSALIREPRYHHSELGDSGEPTARAERRPTNPFNRAVIGPGLAMLALMFTYGAISSFVPLIAIQRGLANPGLFFAVYAGAMIVSQGVAGRLSDRFGRWSAVLVGLTLVVVGIVAVALLGGWWLLVAGGIYGLGAGAASPALYAAAGDLVPPRQRGSAMATMGLFLEMGIASGSILTGILAGLVGLTSAFWAVAGATASATVVIGAMARLRQAASTSQH